MADGLSAGTSYVDVKPDLSTFQRDLGTRLNGITRSLGSRMSAIGKTIGRGLVTAGKASAVAIAGVTVAAVNASREADKANAQTQAVIKSTGGVANVTQKHLADLATRIMNVSGMSDEAVQAGGNMLLTFTNIRNEVGKGNNIFDKATGALANLSAATGKDMRSSAIQLGKALNDPVAGITALTRVGVAFTDQTKERITALVDEGKTMQAQKIILAELTKEFGGSAKAMGKTAEGQFNILKEQVGNTLETIGGSITDIGAKVLPKLGPLLNKALEAIGPGLVQVVKSLSKGLGPVLEAIAPAISAFGKVFAKLADVLAPIAVLIGKVLAKALTALMPALKRVLPILGKAFLDVMKALAPVLPDLAKSLGDLLIALVPLIPPLTKILVLVLKLAGPALTTLVRVFVSVLTPVLKVVGKAIDWLVGVFTHLPEVWEKIKHAASAIWSAIKRVILGAAKAIWGGIKRAWAAITGAIQSAWDKIKSLTSSVWKAITGIIRGAINTVKGVISRILDVIKRIWDNTFGKLITGVKKGWELVVSFLRSIPERIKAFFANAGEWLVEAGKAIIRGLWEGMKSIWHSLTGWLGSLGGWIKDLKGPIEKDRKLLIPEGQAIMDSLSEGLMKGMGGLKGTLVFIGKMIQGAGFLVGENPAFGGVAPVHVPGSYHYQGRALDINWPGPNEPQMLGALAAALQAKFGSKIKELFWPGHDPVGGHQDHLHLAMAKGGYIGEPVVGRGLRSGSSYMFGEAGGEYVIPEDRLAGGLSIPVKIYGNVIGVDDLARQLEGAVKTREHLLPDREP